MIRTIEYLERDGLLSAIVSTVMRSSDQGWHGYPFSVHCIAGDGDVGPIASEARTVVLCIAGEGLLEWQHGQNTARQEVRKGMIWLAQLGYAFGRLRWSGRATVLELQMEPGRRAVSERRLRTEGQHPRSPFEDEGMASLLMAMRSEAARGCPSGQAFAASLSAALAAHIAAAYPEGAISGASNTLSVEELGRLTEYVDEHLAQIVTVEDLAALFGLGVSQFSRRLKATTGTSPYQFLTRRRVDRAHTLLLGSHSLTEVARAVGMPNSSHFIQVFRKQTGVTPGQARAMLHHSTAGSARNTDAGA